MATNKAYTVKFRRKRQNKTNYKARLRLLVSRKNRLVIRKSINKVYLQLVKYNPKGDEVLLNIESGKLKKYGWKYKLNNIPACYLTGLLFGLEAKKHKYDNAILDLGLNVSVKGASLYTAFKGIVDSGLNVPYDKEILPSEDRVKGKHIADYALLLKKNPETYKKQFSAYLSKNVMPEDIVKNFEEVKNKIIGNYSKWKKKS